MKYLFSVLTLAFALISPQQSHACSPITSGDAIGDCTLIDDDKDDLNDTLKTAAIIAAVMGGTYWLTTKMNKSTSLDRESMDQRFIVHAVPLQGPNETVVGLGLTFRF